MHALMAITTCYYDMALILLQGGGSNESRGLSPCGSAPLAPLTLTTGHSVIITNTYSLNVN